MTEHPTDATVTPAMIAAGRSQLARTTAKRLTDTRICRFYLAMNAARTTPIDDEGLELCAQVLWYEARRKMKLPPAPMPAERTDFREAARAAIEAIRASNVS